MTHAQVDLEKRLHPLDPPYVSSGEAKIGRLLAEQGVPFLYRQPMIIYDQGKYAIWNPAFTLREHNSLVIECAHGPDRQQYMREAHTRQQVYKANGVPALYVYPADLTGPGWSGRLADRIHEAREAPGRHRTLDGYLRRI
jgi:hypothetical protein